MDHWSVRWLGVASLAMCLCNAPAIAAGAGVKVDVEEFNAGERVRRQLGLNLQTSKDGYPKLSLVETGSPAANAGFRTGDVIVSMRRSNYSGIEDIERRLAAARDEEIEFEVRSGKGRSSRFRRVKLKMPSARELPVHPNDLPTPRNSQRSYLDVESTWTGPQASAAPLTISKPYLLPPQGKGELLYEDDNLSVYSNGQTYRLAIQAAPGSVLGSATCHLKAGWEYPQPLPYKVVLKRITAKSRVTAEWLWRNLRPVVVDKILPQTCPYAIRFEAHLYIPDVDMKFVYVAAAKDKDTVGVASPYLVDDEQWPKTLKSDGDRFVDTASGEPDWRIVSDGFLSTVFLVPENVPTDGPGRSNLSMSEAYFALADASKRDPNGAGREYGDGSLSGYVAAREESVKYTVSLVQKSQREQEFIAALFVNLAYMSKRLDDMACEDVTIPEHEKPWCWAK